MLKMKQYVQQGGSTIWQPMRI